MRLLNWHNSRTQVSAVQTGVVINYKNQAHLIRQNGLASLYDSSSPTNNPDLLGHPLGYPILVSLTYRLAAESDAASQVLQMTLDSFAAVIICLIAFELSPTSDGVFAGLMAAFAPQFSWNSRQVSLFSSNVRDSLAPRAETLPPIVPPRLRKNQIAFPEGVRPTYPNHRSRTGAFPGSLRPSPR